MRQLFPGILFVFGLTVVALFSDMAGVTLRRIRGADAPNLGQSAPDPALSTSADPYRPALLRGGVPPH